MSASPTKKMVKRWWHIETMYHEGSRVPYKNVVCGEMVSLANARNRKGQLGVPARANLAARRLCWDFLEQECKIMTVVKAAGHLCLFLPKYHYELNIIEFFWGATKHHTRECCDFTLDELDREIEIGQEKVQITTIRRWYHRMMRWVDSYETGAGTVEAQQQVQAFSSKKFKSHRRAPEDDGT